MPVTTAVRREGLQAPAERRKRRRYDALPEFSRYKDDGCDIHDHCLTCPLPRCRYEAPGGLRALLNEQRDQQIFQLRRKGASVDELAGRFGVSRRTIFRILGSGKTARSQPITFMPATLRPAQRGDVPPFGQGEDRRGEESRCA